VNQTPSFPILLLDDDPAWLSSFQFMLMRIAGINNILTCQDSRQIFDIIDQNDIGLVIIDLGMPHVTGNEVLERIKAAHPDVQVIILTGIDEVEEVVCCMKAGAFDYYVKSWSEERLIKGIMHAIHIVELERQCHRVNLSILTQNLVYPEAFAHIVTSSQAMQRIFLYIEATAQSPYPVLITGESGVGKELIARSIHKAGSCTGQFVSINMANLNDSMLEDSLFGHAKGAFTNAHAARKGLAEEAENGILFLDEIGDISPGMQAKLLRFIQEGEYYPLGSDKPKRLLARIVLATNQNLVERQQDGRFRSDLYYRLKTHHIHVPPLRERKEDISLLIKYFMEQTANCFALSCPEISSDLILRLTEYAYPGNVRELQAIITHALMCGKKQLTLEDFPDIPVLSPEQEQTNSAEQILLNIFLRMERMPGFNDVKKIMTTAALTKTGGNQTAAARILGISQPALSMRISTTAPGSPKFSNTQGNGGGSSL
jgi:DNA-binding NtrC family response regulator